MQSRKMQCSEAKRSVKAWGGVYGTFLPSLLLRISKIQPLAQPRGAAVMWQQRQEVLLRSSRRRTNLLLSKSVVDRLIPAY